MRNPLAGRDALTFRRAGLLVANDGSRRSICWARIFSDGERAAVTLTEVPANPGWSVDNRPEVFRDALLREWTGPAPRWFTCSPAGFASQSRARWHEITFAPGTWAGSPHWTATNRTRVEAVVGRTLPSVPAQEQLLQMVLEAGGKLEEAPPTQLFIVIPVGELPPPHNPFKCTHRERFGRLAREHPNLDELEIGQAFIASLGPDDHASCICHEGNWLAIATTAVEAVRRYGPRPTDRQLAALASHSGLPPDDRRRMRTLFGAEAITISNGRFQDGQHRACALRAAGASEVVVATDGPPSRPPSTWTLRDEG